MAFTVTEITTVSDGTAAQPNWVSSSFNVSAGDLIVVAEGHQSSAAPTSIVDSLGNSYVKEEQSNRSTFAFQSLWAFYYAAPATGITVTITYAASVNLRQAKVIRVAGASSSFLSTVTAGGTAGNAVISNNGLNTTVTTGSMTPTAPVLVLALLHYNNTTAPSATPSGYTRIGTDLTQATRHTTLSAYYKEQVSIGAENPAWTITSIEWAAGQMGIVPGVSGTPDFATQDFRIVGIAPNTDVKTQDFRIVGIDPTAPVYTQLETHLTAVTRSATW